MIFEMKQYCHALDWRKCLWNVQKRKLTLNRMFSQQSPTLWAVFVNFCITVRKQLKFYDDRFFQKRYRNLKKKS